MGDMTKQDEAISVELMGALMAEFEKDWIRVTSGVEKPDAEIAEVLFPALFSVLASRGPKVLLCSRLSSRTFLFRFVLIFSRVTFPVRLRTTRGARLVDDRKDLMLLDDMLVQTRSAKTHL